MWKGWINLLAAGWFVLAAGFTTLMTAESFVIFGVVLFILGFIKMKSWHDLGNIAMGFWLVTSALLLGWLTTASFLVNAVIIAYLGVMIIKNNTPEMVNNNA